MERGRSATSAPPVSDTPIIWRVQRHLSGHFHHLQLARPISVFGFAGFFLYEAYVSAERAAIPPKTWFLPNFSVLFGSALFPNLWFVTVFGIFSAYWQGIWGWSPISTAVHL